MQRLQRSYFRGIHRSFSTSTSFPTNVIENVFWFLRDDICLSWVSIIVGVPWATKAAFILPLAIYSQKKLERIAPTLNQAKAELNKAFAASAKKDGEWSPEALGSYHSRLTEVKEKYGYNPKIAPSIVSLPSIAQSIIHISMFRCLKNFQEDGWGEGGPSFALDLGAADSTYALPFATGLLVCILLDLPPTFTYGRFIAPIVITPIFANFSTAVNMYFLSNMVGFVAQKKLLKIDSFRAMVGLQPATYLDNYERPATITELVRTIEERYDTFDGGGYSEPDTAKIKESPYGKLSKTKAKKAKRK